MVTTAPVLISKLTILQQEGGETFTAEQDALILSLKAEGKTWAEIGVAIGRGKKTAQSRHKELTKDGEGVAAAKKDEPKEDDGKFNVG